MHLPNSISSPCPSLEQVQSAEAALAGRLLEVPRRHQLEQQADAGLQGAASASSSGDAEGACGGGEEGRDGSRTCAAASGGGNAGAGRLRMQWLDESREHLFRWREPRDGGSGGQQKAEKKKRGKGRQHLLYFPTPAALAERLAAAAGRGMGAAVWELGQGLEAFCTLL